MKPTLMDIKSEKSQLVKGKRVSTKKVPFDSDPDLLRSAPSVAICGPSLTGAGGWVTSGGDDTTFIEAQPCASESRSVFAPP